MRIEDDFGRSGKLQRHQSSRGSLISSKFSIPPPILDFSPEPVDTFQRMQRDGLAPEDLIQTIQSWAYAHAEEVDKVAISYSVRRYSLSVLLVALSESLVRKMYQETKEIAGLFGPHAPLVYVLGPNQRESLLFATPGSIEIQSSYRIKGSVLPGR